jgi:AhpD family alkylhydroperoxidase
MSRLNRIAPENWDPQLRQLCAADTAATSVELGPMSLFANCPPIAKALAHFGMALRASRTLPERLYELVRLRIAFHNQCRSCMAIRYRNAVDDGLDEPLVCSLEKPMDAPDLTATEKAALDYADRFATDHLSIDDATYDGLREHFNEGQLVELGSWIAFCVGFGRLMATWHMVEDLPEGFQVAQGQTLTPSSGKPVTVR